MLDDKIILGFETSCDETAIAIMKGDELLVNTISSQIDIHEKFGGVVPEVASRAHAEMIRNIFHSSLNNANLQISDIDIVSTTDGPGLVGSLVVGYNFAKSIAWSIDKPFFTVDHMVGHLAAPLIENKTMKPPFITLLVSGGHTQIVLVEEWGSYQLLGTTIDDAAGEAFDKSAKVLGLKYPGGPLIDKYAKEGNINAFTFGKPKIKELDFSFSGLKTSIMNKINSSLMTNPKFIDENLKLWLIEVNTLPSYATDSPLDRTIKFDMIYETIAMLNLTPTRREWSKRDRAEELKRPHKGISTKAHRE